MATYPNSNRSVAHIGFTGLWHRVVVDVDDLVEIPGDNFSHLFQSLEIVGFCRCIDELIDSDGG